MQIDLGVVLLLLRCAMLLAISLTLGAYHDPSARKRWVVSLLAVCAAGGSLGWAVLSALMLLHGRHDPDPWIEVWPALFVLCVLIPVLYTRGNVAKLLPRLRWSDRP